MVLLVVLTVVLVVVVVMFIAVVAVLGLFVDFCIVESVKLVQLFFCKKYANSLLFNENESVDNLESRNILM